MDIHNLKKDPERIYSALRVMPDNSVVAVKKITACFPKRYENNGLVSIGESVIGVMMIGLVHDDAYCTLGGMARISMKPGDIREETIDNERYYLLDFLPGDVVVESLVVPVENSLSYTFYMEYTKYARIPWYANESIVLSISDEADFFTGKPMGTSNQAIRVLYALTMRDKTNLDIPYRYSPDFNKPGSEPKTIGINNPGQLLNSTFSRLSSGYMSDNLIAGILNPDTKVTDLEEIIRGLPNGIGDNSNV